jgi:hypothetical protein
VAVAGATADVGVGRAFVAVVGARAGLGLSVVVEPPALLTCNRLRCLPRQRSSNRNLPMSGTIAIECSLDRAEVSRFALNTGSRASLSAMPHALGRATPRA